MNSKGKVNQFAVVVDGTWKYFKDGEISASFTWNDAKDNTSYNGNVANSATLSLPVVDDPRNLSNMTYSNGQFRNKVVVYGTLPSFYGIKAGIRYSGIGGTRYSLLSGGNTNGDFVATNDLAYIFNTANTSVPAALRTALQTLLANGEASQSLKDYITKYEGTFAERNGGINGFYGTIDLRLAYQFKFGSSKKQSLEISGDLFNVANLFKKTWGTSETLGTQALYAVTGFDAASSNYNYRLNNTGVVIPTGTPWQAQIGLRYGF